MLQTERTRYITRVDAHHRLIIASILTVLSFILFRSSMTFEMDLLVSFNVFSGSILIMVWILMLSTHPKQVRKMVGLQDSSRSAIFVFVILAAIASLFAVVLLLQSSAHLSKTQLDRHVLLSIASVVNSWSLMHSIFAIRYAHIFYTDDRSPSSKPTGKGLLFPNEEESPDYIDFAYFSFIIGMTFQVSDVEISSRRIRRIVLVQSLLSFAFNTIIVALSINVISGLIAH